MANVLSLMSFINGSKYSLLTQSKNPKELWDWIEGENALMYLLLSSGDAGGIPVQNYLISQVIHYAIKLAPFMDWWIERYFYHTQFFNKKNWNMW